MDDGAERFAGVAGVSRETAARVALYLEMLREASLRANLIGRGDLANLWERHVMDSAQLLDLAPPEARGWLDLGSGAGFPGIVLALMMREREGACVTLVEARRKKARFLEAVIKETEAPARLLCRRIEDLAKDPARPPPDVITARALAPFPRLLQLSFPFFGSSTIALFPKGRSWEKEMKETPSHWRIKRDILPSRTDSFGRIIRVRSLEHLSVARKREPCPNTPPRPP